MRRLFQQQLKLQSYETAIADIWAHIVEIRQAKWKLPYPTAFTLYFYSVLRLNNNCAKGITSGQPFMSLGNFFQFKDAIDDRLYFS